MYEIVRPGEREGGKKEGGRKEGGRREREGGRRERERERERERIKYIAEVCLVYIFMHSQVFNHRDTSHTTINKQQMDKNHKMIWATLD